MKRRTQRLRDSLLRLLGDANRSPQHRFRPRLESLEDRRLLVAAIDLADVVGQVFDDFSGNGYDVGEEVSGAALDIYRDDGDGVFEPGTGDVEVAMAMTDSNGNYRFERLTAGDYFVLQPAQTVSGHALLRSVSPLITISTEDVKGRIATSIDTFNTAAQKVTDTTNDNIPVTSFVAADSAQVIGGERDLIVNKTSADGSVELSVNDPLLPNQLIFNSPATGLGTRRVTWDGVDGAIAIDDTGLGGVNLTTDALGLQLQIRANLAGGNAIVRIYSNDGIAGTADRFSTATIPIPVTQGTFQSAEFIPFSAFTSTSGGGADFTDVGAIELEIATTVVDVNGASELVGAVGTIVKTANFANFDQADLSLSKTVDDPSPNLNQEVTFTLTINNSGPDTATGVVVTDLLPSGIQFERFATDNGSYDSANGRWTVGSVAVGSPAVLTITGTVTSVGEKTNSAEITASDQFDTDSTPNNQLAGEDDQASVAIAPQTIDLSLTQTIADASPNVGDTVTFVVTLRNDGPSTATNVSVRDLLPAGVTLTTATPSQGNYNTSSGIWTVPSLISGGSVALSLSGVVNQSGSFINTAEVTAADQTDSDSVPNNNDADEDDQASLTIVTPVADLQLTQTVDNPAPNVGDEVIFTVTISNQGPAPASGVVVSDLLPAGLESISSTVNAGVYNDTTGRWVIGDVSTTDAPTLTIRARVQSSTAITNTAEVIEADQFDPDSTPGNDIPSEDDQDSATVAPSAIDLSLTQSVDTPRPNVGDEIQYTITLDNAGPDTATSIIVRDVLPTGLTFLSATESVGTYTSADGNWSVPSLAPADSPATLQLRVRVDSQPATANSAEVIQATQFDPDSTPNNDDPGEDDQAAVSITLASADLSLTKTVDVGSPNIGDNVVFTIRVTNDGPDVATNVSIRDELPTGTRFVSSNPSVGSYDSITGIWTVPSVGLSSTETLTITAVTDTASMTTNTAEIISVDQSDPDSVAGNGNANEDDIATATIQAQQIDLSLSLAVNDTAPNVGDEITFVITVDNAGPSDATGVRVTDVLPAGLTLVDSTPSQGSFNTSSGVWSVGNVSITTQPTLQLVVRVDQVLTDTINVAEITAADQPDTDSTPGNNDIDEDDQDSVTISTPVADLSLVQTVTNDTPNVGDQVTFEILLTNDGPSPATSVQVSDLLPDAVRFDSTTLSAGTYDADTGIWDIGSVGSGETVSLGINVTITGQGTQTNTARVSQSDQFDPDSTPGNNVEAEDDQASASVTPPVIDLSLQKTASLDRPAIGQNVTFTITAQNDGVSDATGVVIRDALPAGLNFVDSNASVGSYNATTGIWSLGAIAAGSSETLEITATVTQVDAVTNVAEVIAANQFDSDSTPDNQDENEDDLASVSITPASADLSLTKTVDDSLPNVGQEVTFTLTLSNAGPDTAEQITVRDSLPAGLDFVGSSPSVGDYDSATGIWTIDSLASGATATLDIRAAVAALTDRTNTAEVLTSSQFDPDSTPGNGDDSEDDQASVTLSPQLVDLALSKVLDDPAPNVGDTIAFTLTLSNDGPSDATGVAVTDRLPDGLVFENFIASQGSYNSASGLWNVGNVAKDAAPTLTINATVGQISGATNTAEITAADQVDRDSTPGNNDAGEDDQASVEFVTQVADLSLTKTASTSAPTQNEVIRFTLTLTNSGPSTATDISVRDVLPSGLTFVSADPSVGSYDPANGIWTLASVSSSSNATLRIDARATSPQPSTNTAEIMLARQFDPDSTPGNGVAAEDDIASVLITPVVIDLDVSASVDNDAPVEGDEILMTFLTQNSGNVAATGVVTSVMIPAGLRIVSSTPDIGSYNPVSGRWEIGTLGVGATATLTVRAVVENRELKTIPVQVIAADQFDIDSTPGNDEVGEDDQTDLIIRAPRTLTKRLFLSR
ncbi:hypothetical protein K227x_59750 [Rubripirellula lacrimiformis]|uniref:DUF11 domain-containing protein n=1 Tax=Rubripirellula lacrimiformis TaxID=1930273 RepID=A0A517NK79_9BACT|nr:DUF11 domain-containing protein [Rubripirellula lacrimiformis]QDT07547.1 hypothetical protein K227x_59750 [Rubripirellula lacrimiformis]